MGTGLTTKVAAFCRELGENTLADLAREQNKEAVLKRAEDALKAGEIGPGLEADLDALDAMLRRAYGQGLFQVTRGYTPLPPYVGDSGARWWTCPGNLCAGRGRVRPGQGPPVCGATSEPLTAGPLPE